MDIFTPAWNEQRTKPDNAKAGFMAAGIFPFDPNKIGDDAFKVSDALLAASCVSSTSTLTAPISSSSPFSTSSLSAPSSRPTSSVCSTPPQFQKKKTSDCGALDLSKNSPSVTSAKVALEMAKTTDTHPLMTQQPAKTSKRGRAPAVARFATDDNEYSSAVKRKEQREKPKGKRGRPRKDTSSDESDDSDDENLPLALSLNL